MHFLKALTLCCLIGICAGQQLQYAILSVNYTQSNSEESCAVYNSSTTELPNAPSGADFPVILVNSQTRCVPDTLDTLNGSAMMAFVSENCSMTELTVFGQRLNASLIVFIVPKANLVISSTTMVSVGDSVNVPVLLVDNFTGIEIQENLEDGSTVYLQSYAPSRPFDYPGVIILCIIAVTTVVLGPFLANTPYKFLKRALLYPDGQHLEKLEKPAKKFKDLSAKEKRIYIVVTVVFMTVLSGILSLFILLYFYYSVIVYIFIALFALLSIFTFYITIGPFVASVPYINGKLRLPPNKIPILRNRPGPLFFLTFLFSIGIVIWWVVERNSLYGWALHAILGFCYCTYFYRKMTAIKRPWLAALLMFVSVFIDVFLVLISRLLTPDGRSAIELYTLGPDGFNERVPIVFTVIQFIYPTNLDTVCNIPRSNSFLGFGDALVPGLLVVLALRHDLTVRVEKRFKAYYFTVCIVFIIGLILKFVVEGVTDIRQPTLLFVVPTTLVSLVILSLLLGEFRQFFFPAKAKEAHVEESSKESTGNGEVKTGTSSKTESGEAKTETSSKTENGTQELSTVGASPTA